MTLNQKIEWRASCEAVLQQFGFRAWFEFSEELAIRRQLGDRRPQAPGWFNIRFVYPSDRDLWVSLRLPCRHDGPDNLLDRPFWRLSWRRQILRSGSDAEGLRAALVSEAGDDEGNAAAGG